jgi:hypothetical protein
MNQQFAELEVIHLERLRIPDAVVDANIEAKLPPEQLPDVNQHDAVVMPLRNPADTLDNLLSDRQQGQASLEQLDKELFADLDDLQLDNSTVGNVAGVVTGAAEPVKVKTEEQFGGMSFESTDLDANAEAAVQMSPEDSALHQQVSQLALGAWVEMVQADEKKFRARLAAIIKATGRYIFVNRTGMKVAEHTRETLMLAIQSGQLIILDEGQLFDRALESVIGNLRQMRS